jgi:hypothetical protein
MRQMAYLNITELKNMKIIGDETCDNYENNKWYFWRDENKNRLLHMVKLLFSPGYEYTKLPLSAITIEWKSTYDEHWNIYNIHRH